MLWMGIFLDVNKKKRGNSVWDEENVAIVVTERVDKNWNSKQYVI